MSDRALIQIGFRLFSDSAEQNDSERIDIEETLLSVIETFPGDHRLASVLLSWIKVHGKHVIVEKMAKIAKRAEHGGNGASTWLSLVAAWAVECGYHKWGKLARPVAGPVYLYDPDVSESAIGLKGLLSWPDPLGFRIPKGSLRIRESDVLTPDELIAVNPQYRNRYLYGASWRADIITAVQQGISSPMAISRLLGCSYEPAHRISREYRMAIKMEASAGGTASTPEGCASRRGNVPRGSASAGKRLDAATSAAPA